jgi:hypothetical protein
LVTCTDRVLVAHVSMQLFQVNCTKFLRLDDWIPIVNWSLEWSNTLKL